MTGCDVVADDFEITSEQNCTLVAPSSELFQPVTFNGTAWVGADTTSDNPTPTPEQIALTSLATDCSETKQQVNALEEALTDLTKETGDEK